jgi:hypothetical protein
MRNSVKIMLGIAMMGLSTTAYALPPNPYGDVSLKGWEYAAVDQLKRDGLIDKYAESFSLNKASTREEMARMVARAVWNKDKANNDDTILIAKLSNEFSSELSMLGVYVEGVNDKAAPVVKTGEAAPAKKRFLDKLNIHGFFHISDQVWNNSGVYENSSESPHKNDGAYPAVGFDIFMDYQVNDRWGIHVEDEIVRDMRSGGYSTGPDYEGMAQTNQHFDQMYVAGRIGAVDTKIGRYEYKPVYGAVMTNNDRAVNGIQLGVHATPTTYILGTYGYLRENWFGMSLNPYFITTDGNDNRYAALEIQQALPGNANIKAAYHYINNGETNESHDIYEIGADKRFNDRFRIYGEFAKSNADDGDHSYLAGMEIGAVHLDKKGSQQLNLRYLYAGTKSTIGPSNDWWVGSTSNYQHGYKGPQMNYTYMLDKNIDFTLWASYLKPTDGSDGTLKTYKLEFDYFF